MEHSSQALQALTQNVVLPQKGGWIGVVAAAGRWNASTSTLSCSLLSEWVWRFAEGGKFIHSGRFGVESEFLGSFLASQAVLPWYTHRFAILSSSSRTCRIREASVIDPAGARVSETCFLIVLLQVNEVLCKRPKQTPTATAERQDWKRSWSSLWPVPSNGYIQLPVVSQIRCYTHFSVKSS